MRCLYCGKQLALFKKLTGGGEFCSDAHKQSYHEEYNKLALSRLMEAQTRQEDQPARKPGAGVAAPTPPEKPAFVEPTARGGYCKQPVLARALGGTAMLASLAQEPTGWPIGFPAACELHFAPEPGQAGVIMEHRAVSGNAAILPASEIPRMCPDPRCAFPEHHFEIDTTVAPAAAGPVGLDACPAAPPEPELRLEPAAGFQFSWELPESLDPEWVDGLEFASSEQKLATVLLGSPRQSAAPEETEAATAPAVPFLASVTTEPVIDEALLFSLLGGDDEAAPLPTPALAAAVLGTDQPQAAPGVSAADTAEGPVPPHEPGSFMPVTIRPAGAPNKPRLMQSFQAITLVSANPQIPAWNMLPLRPKMTLGRPPGPGAGLVDRGKPEAGAPSEARKPGSAAVDVANGPERPEDLSVSTFGSTAKPRTGLSRWFKLSILVGVLGIAGSSGWLFHPAEKARQDMTTEFAVCRN
ncbi:MAG: hypothetical protein ABSH47_02040 [Bryobacteraceae bacterium]